MTHGTGREHDARLSDAVLLAAGAADWALGGLATAVESMRGFLGRADLGELAEEGRQDLRARGRLVLDRLPASSPAHLEVLARHAAARRAPGAGHADV
jgi:hypothetical protein